MEEIECLGILENNEMATTFNIDILKNEENYFYIINKGNSEEPFIVYQEKNGMVISEEIILGDYNNLYSFILENEKEKTFIFKGFNREEINIIYESLYDCKEIMPKQEDKSLRRILKKTLFRKKE